MSTTEPNGAAEPTNEPTPTTGPTHVADTSVDAPTGATTVIDTPAETAPAAAPVAEPEPLIEPPAPEPAAPYVAPVAATAPDAAPAEAPIDYASHQEPEPYVSPSTIAAPAAVAGAAGATAVAPETVAPEAYEAPAASYPNDAYPAPATPIYVQAPTPPVNKGNRGFGILVGLIATAAFAVLYSIVALITAGVFTGDGAAEAFQDFAVRPVFYVPIIVFFGAFALLSAIINRSGWWSWVLGAFFGAVLVYFSYIGASLLTVGAWNLTYDEAVAFLANRWFDPLAIGAAVIAREVPIWFGAWIAQRGRKVSERNVAARIEYDRVLAEGPTLSR